MTPQELRSFLDKHELTPSNFAILIGVTYICVLHWLDGRRSISLPISRMIRLFDRRPELMKEFKK